MRYGTMRSIQLSLWPEDVITQVSCQAEDFIGKAGRRLFVWKGMNKSSTIFNADIFNEKGERIWFGDIDIYKDRWALLRLSAKAGGLFIFNRTGSNMFTSHMPSPEQIRSLASIIVKEGKISFSKEFAEKVEVLSKRIKKQEEHANAYRYRKCL